MKSLFNWSTVSLVKQRNKNDKERKIEIKNLIL